jgi:tryptophan synthase alpha chain
MNRLGDTFARLKAEHRAALMPYLPLGFPTLGVSQQLIRAAADAGADVIELGVPFSDPLADGPVIQRATHIALQNGMTLAKCFDMVREARRVGVTTPLTLMGYYNPILQFGVKACARAACEAGADGFIVPDLPPEEAGEFATACRAAELDLIFLAAPTSTPERLRVLVEATRGFLYLVSVTGVTGARAQVASDLSEFVQRVRAVTDKPVCVGFGIANAENARTVAQLADGVIVGSALVSRIDSAQNAVSAAQAFITELRAALRPVDQGAVSFYS